MAIGHLIEVNRASKIISAPKDPKDSKALKEPLGGYIREGRSAFYRREELSYSIEVLQLRAKSNSRTSDKYGQESERN